MTSFSSPGAFAKFLAQRVAELPGASSRALHGGGAIVRQEARDSLGHYQAAAGPIPAWDPLSEQRQRRRVDAGLTPDDPLLATDVLHDSIGLRADEHTAEIGSDEERAIAMEQGVAARNVPPRPFLARAAYVKSHEVAETIASHVFGAITGRTP